eukprot:scaffold11875_cov35-Phaeocystis_antarctica.AAC.1
MQANATPSPIKSARRSPSLSLRPSSPTVLSDGILGFRAAQVLPSLTAHCPLPTAHCPPQ